jgi:diguanylate cyclase (GGDEF)-like protein
MSTRRRRDHRPAVYVYTAATIAAGVVAFALALAAFPIDAGIALTLDADREGILLGLVFWIVIGLLGGLRVQRLHGHGVLTFHFPFIIAATALGGPMAGAIVAMVSTIEPRELRPSEVPWYGTLSNHAVLTFAAVVGGITMEASRQILGSVPLEQPQAVELASIAIGSLVFALIATGLVAGTIALRDGRTLPEALRVFDSAYRTTAAAEVVLGWLLWLTYSTVGWWGALVCAMLVLLIWSAYEAIERAQHDALTGLYSRDGFSIYLDEAMSAASNHDQESLLMFIDLDGFKQINDTHGHEIGDLVIEEVGRRLRTDIRLTDAAVRFGGDEFGVLFTRYTHPADALMLAKRTHQLLCQPMHVGLSRPVMVGASIGAVVLTGDLMATTRIRSRLIDRVDTLMYRAKRDHGGIVFVDGDGREERVRAPRRPVQRGRKGRANLPVGVRRGGMPTDATA